MEKTQSGISVKKSIRRRILDGYFKVLLPSVLLGVITIICLSVLFEFYGNTT